MKIVRYINENNEINYGSVEDNFIIPFSGSPFADKQILMYNNRLRYDSSILLSPCTPTKIIALAINYEGATGQTINMLEPLVFLKGTNCISNCNDSVKIAFPSETWGESELGVVIKKEMKNISIVDVGQYILGYCPVNDVSCENIDDRDHHLARSKSADGYCPVGHWIDTQYDYQDKLIEAYHNDILIRKGKTSEMLWKPEKIVSWLSNWMTLYPGDIISTGAPVRTRDRLYLSDGDTFTVRIEGFQDLVTSFYE